MAGGGTQSTSQMKTFGGAPAYTPDPTSTMLQPPPAAPQGAPASYGSIFSQAPQITVQQPSYAQMYSPYAQMNAQYNQIYSPFRSDVQSMYGRGQQMANQYGQGQGLQAISPVGQIGYQNAMANFMQPRGIQGLPAAQQYQMSRPANFYYQPSPLTLARPVATKASAAKEAEEARLAAEAAAAAAPLYDSGYYVDFSGGDGGGGGGSGGSGDGGGSGSGSGSGGGSGDGGGGGE